MKPYIPHPKQKAFHTSTKKYKNIVAGRRGGKSEAAGEDYLLGIIEDQANPELAHWGERQYWCVAPSEDLTGLQKRKLEASARRYNIPLKTKGEEARIPGWPVWIRFRTSGNKDRLIADDIWGLWLDEAAKMRPWAWGYLEPGLTATGGWCITSTTPEGQNWYYDEFWRMGDPLDSKYDPRYSNHHFTSADNPYLSWICPACVTSYRAWSPGWEARACPVDGTALVHEAVWKKARLPRRTYEREYEASFTAFMGQVWEALNKGLHWGIAPKHMRRLIGAQDWNFALPGVYLLLGEDMKGGWWVLDEIHQARLPVWDDAGPCWVNKIKSLNSVVSRSTKAKVDVIWADPAEPEHISTEKKKGLPVRKANNAVAPGIQSVDILLHDIPGQGPRLKFDTGRDGRPRAMKTWRQMQSYCYAEGSEKPIKVNDHACDAVRYGIYSTLGKISVTRGMQSGRIF